MSQERQSRIQEKLTDIDCFVDWEALVDEIQIIDKTGSKRGGRPRYPLIKMLKMVFLQHLYNLSDPELEDQLLDRRSFREFVGITSDEEVPDFSTIWIFKDKLIEHELLNGLFERVVIQLESDNLILKKGTIVDATIITSNNRPLSKQKRFELEAKEARDEKVSQLDLDAHSTHKGGEKFFGYKGHIGVDVGSKLIRRRAFTAANVHDSQIKLFCGDEASIWGDKAYSKIEDKRDCRAKGIFYGVLDKATRRRGLSNKKKKRNGCLSGVRSAVEHPFAYMTDKLGYGEAVAKTQARNSLRFDLNCMLHNVMRAIYLLKAQRRWA